MENMEKIKELLQSIYPWLIKNGMALLGAVVVLIIGLWIVKKITKFFGRSLEKAKVDPSLRPFLTSLFNVLLKILLVISVMSMVGIEMTSFIAILGAFGLAIGMALSGTLQNFAGGVLILILKPFKVGDFISAQGFTGTVNEIQVFSTILKTVDNKTILLPNGPLSTSPVTNFSTEAQRRVDLVFGIGYNDDIEKAKSVLWEIINADTRVLKDPQAFVAVSELADSSVNFTVRLWVNAADYWGVHFDTIEKVKKEFDAKGISIPFPQRDIHVFNEK